MGLSTYITGTAGVIAVGAIAWGLWQGSRIDTLNATLDKRNAVIQWQGDEIDRAAEVSKNNAAAAEWFKTELARRSELAAETEKKRRATARRLDQTLEEIRNAPVTADGPIAPVLLEQFDRLRGSDTDADGGDGGNENRDAGHPRGQAPLPGGETAGAVAGDAPQS